MWNGTVFIDLDWPLNASNLLSASAELLVYRTTTVTTVIYSLGHELCAPFLQCLGQRSYHFHKGRFLLTPMKNNSVIVSPLKKNVFGRVKKEDLTTGQTDPKGLPPPKTCFWVHWAEIYSVSCERVEVTKKWKESKQGYNFTHMPTHPAFSAATIFCVSDRRGK